MLANECEEDAFWISRTKYFFLPCCCSTPFYIRWKLFHAIFITTGRVAYEKPPKNGLHKKLRSNSHIYVYILTSCFFYAPFFRFFNAPTRLFCLLHICIVRQTLFFQVGFQHFVLFFLWDSHISLWNHRCARRVHGNPTSYCRRDRKVLETCWEQVHRGTPSLCLLSTWQIYL